MTRARGSSLRTASREKAPANITRLRAALLRWYRVTARDLPWRRDQNPYRVWLSEIMLQQTRVETVIPYFERFLTAFPNVQTLAKADEHDVLRLWAGLGYYSRARNLHAAAKLIAKNGFSTTVEGWRELPGVGPYAAGAIASIAFGRRAAAVDGNVKRVLARINMVDGDIRTPTITAIIWRIAEGLVPENVPGDFNQALMELGARICLPRNPRCDECPARRLCGAAVDGRQTDFPVSARKSAAPVVHAVALAMTRADTVLLERRASGGLLGGLWGLPTMEVSGGVVDPQDVPTLTTLRDRVRRVTRIEPPLATAIADVRHVFTHKDLRLKIYMANDAMRRRQRRALPDGFAWAKSTELDRFALSTLDRKALTALWPAMLE